MPAAALTWPISLKQDDRLLHETVQADGNFGQPAAVQRCLAQFTLQLGRALCNIAGAVHDQANNRTFHLRE